MSHWNGRIDEWDTPDLCEVDWPPKPSPLKAYIIGLALFAFGIFWTHFCITKSSEYYDRRYTVTLPNGETKEGMELLHATSSRIEFRSPDGVRHGYYGVPVQYTEEPRD